MKVQSSIVHYYFSSMTCIAIFCERCRVELFDKCEFQVPTNNKSSWNFNKSSLDMRFRVCHVRGLQNVGLSSKLIFLNTSSLTASKICFAFIYTSMILLMCGSSYSVGFRCDGIKDLIHSPQKWGLIMISVCENKRKCIFIFNNAELVTHKISD